jgi:hypothetical protein
MPVTTFPEYARQVSRSLDTVAANGQARLFSLEIDQRSLLRGRISGLLRFDDDSELHFREFVDTSLPEPKLMYAYHYQDANKALVFRYDNAVHRPPVSRPEHKHTPTGVATTPAPSLAGVIDEILSIIG